MYYAEQALLDHIDGWDPTRATIKTLDGFGSDTGKMVERPEQITKPVPAVYVGAMDAEYGLTADNPYELAVIVIADSKTLDRKAKGNNAKQVLESLCRWLVDNRIFAHGGRNWEINLPMQAGVFAMSPKYATFVIKINLTERK